VKRRRHIIILGVLMLTACVYPYEASLSEDMEAMLVVEGDIIVNGITHIRLSRTTSLNEFLPPVVSGAQIYVEDEQGGRCPVPEISPGQYEAETSHLDLQQRYRLHVTLVDQRQYASAYVPVCLSPPVDSVGYILNDDATAIAVHVSTHDEKGQARYYKWSYVETWEVAPQWESELLFDLETMRYRNRFDEEYIYYCWMHRNSSEILIGNSTRLSDDVIAGQKLLIIPEQDPRVAILYGIQFAQMALTREAYIYWENLRKNSEDMGGIFSPQPSETYGNIYAIDEPDEVVLGYISAGTQTLSERKFIPGGLMKKIPWVDCDCETIHPPLDTNSRESPLTYLNIRGVVPVMYTDDMSKVIWHRPRCADCRALGGTKEKPIWWPNHHI
jgi:hypothetical protein